MNAEEILKYIDSLVGEFDNVVDYTNYVLAFLDGVATQNKEVVEEVVVLMDFDNELNDGLEVVD